VEGATAHGVSQATAATAHAASWGGAEAQAKGWVGGGGWTANVRTSCCGSADWRRAGVAPTAAAAATRR
jgi:hypothetical protein